MSSEKKTSIYHEAYDYLVKRVPDFSPKIGVVCGSGLGGFVNAVQNPISISYSEIPNFPVSTVQGHKGCLVFGYLHGQQIICMQGRFHLYEGYPPQTCVIPIRVMKLFGVERLVLTNAAGGLNKDYKTGDFMILKDHIDWNAMTGRNPLVGPNDDYWGPRFVAMNDAYDRHLQKIGLEVGEALKENVRHGVYSCVSGPSYETIAEQRLAAAVGVDALGMSTTYEVMAARHCGIKCFAVSLITNQCNPTYDEVTDVNHEEVVECGRVRGEAMQAFIGEVLRRWTTEMFDTTNGVGK